MVLSTGGPCFQGAQISFVSAVSAEGASNIVRLVPVASLQLFPSCLNAVTINTSSTGVELSYSCKQRRPDAPHLTVTACTTCRRSSCITFDLDSVLPQIGTSKMKLKQFGNYRFYLFEG